MLHSKIIRRDDIDIIFDALADEYLKLNGEDIFDVYLVGGAAIVLNFEYRASTIDIDACFKNNQQINQAIDEVSKRLDLPKDWLNCDFMATPSYSPVIVNKAKLYKAFRKVIKVHLLEPKYLIAMKLKSSRPTGGDLDDVIRMIYELRYKNIPISYEEIINAYKELYLDFSNTYDYFLKKTREAFDTPMEDFEYLFKKY